MPTLELKRIGNAYVADQPQCGSCRGCASQQTAIVLPFDVSSEHADLEREDSLLISFSTTHQLMTLYYSWILPLLGCVSASLICSLAGLTDMVAAGMATLAFVTGLLFCRTQGVNRLLMRSSGKACPSGE